MTLLGILVLVLGTALLVAEAHVPGGILGALGGAAMVAGGVILIGALGAGAAVAVPIGIGLGLAAAGFTVVAAGTAARTQRQSVRSGAEGLPGHVGVVRGWNETAGQVFVDGALWRARREWAEPGEPVLREGDPVVVERVSGLTLCVRRADEWEVLG
jgi:membrane-bound ClpP family serine protease